VVNARNSRPSGASESKSIISRWRSSTLEVLAARRNVKVEAGAGVAIGSKPRFRWTHRRSITMFLFLLIQTYVVGFVAMFSSRRAE